MNLLLTLNICITLNAIYMIIFINIIYIDFFLEENKITYFKNKSYLGIINLLFIVMDKSIIHIFSKLS